MSLISLQSFLMTLCGTRKSSLKRAQIYVQLPDNLIFRISFSGEHIGSLVEKDSIRQILDWKSVQVGVQVHPDLYRYLSNNTLSDETFLNILPCHALAKAVGNKTFLRGLKEEILVKITGLTQITWPKSSAFLKKYLKMVPKKIDFFTCIQVKIDVKAVHDLFEDRQLVEKLPASHIGLLLERPTTRFFKFKQHHVVKEFFPFIPYPTRLGNFLTVKSVSNFINKIFSYL